MLCGVHSTIGPCTGRVSLYIDDRGSCKFRGSKRDHIDYHIDSFMCHLGIRSRLYIIYFMKLNGNKNDRCDGLFGATNNTSTFIVIMIIDDHFEDSVWCIVLYR